MSDDLIVAVDAHQRHSIGKHTDDHHAEQRPHHPTLAALEARTSKQHGRDDQKLVTYPGRRNGSGRLAYQEQPANPAQMPFATKIAYRYLPRGMPASLLARGLAPMA